MPWLAFAIIASGVVAIAAWKAKGSGAAPRAQDLFGKTITLSNGSSGTVNGQSQTQVQLATDGGNVWVDRSLIVKVS